MSIKKHIPNFITLMNLLAGIFSIYLGMKGEIQLSAALIFVAAIFDFFDGFLAKILKAKSDLGVQLDSLADMVSFGVAPAFILFHTISMTNDIQGYGTISDILIFSVNIPIINRQIEFLVTDLPFFAFIIPLFSAIRLAKFNIDENQSSSFIGMPTPAVALLLASFPIMILGCLADNKGLYYDIVTNPYFLAGTAVVSSFLMVSRLPMFALKFTSVSWSENQTRYIFIVLSVFLIILLKLAAIPLIILMYLLLSIVLLFSKSKTGDE